jgi:hypothetical protein
VELLLPASEYLGFTGRRIHTLTATGAGGTTRSLRFAVQSVTPAGITAIRAPISVQGLTGRPNNTMTFNLTLAQPAEAGQRFSWQLGAGSTAVAPATCFTATTGTESPPVGAATVPVTLTISGNAASCDGRNFTLTAQPAGTTAAIYQRSQGFTVLPLIAVRDPGSPPPTVVPNVIRP